MTPSDFKKMPKSVQKLNEGVLVRKTTERGKKLPQNAKKHKFLEFITGVLDKMSIKYVEEYKFNPDRKFRFDVAIVDKKLACEYEGLVSSGKGGHQTKVGYTSNCIKYNLAAKDGWVVLRYTALNYRDFEQDIKQILNIS